MQIPYNPTTDSEYRSNDIRSVARCMHYSYVSAKICYSCLGTPVEFKRSYTTTHYCFLSIPTDYDKYDGAAIRRVKKTDRSAPTTGLSARNLHDRLNIMYSDKPHITVELELKRIIEFVVIEINYFIRLV